MQILISAELLALQKIQKALDVICDFVASYSMVRLSNNNQIVCMLDRCTTAYVINIYCLKIYAGGWWVLRTFDLIHFTKTIGNYEQPLISGSSFVSKYFLKCHA